MFSAFDKLANVQYEAANAALKRWGKQKVQCGGKKRFFAKNHPLSIFRKIATLHDNFFEILLASLAEKEGWFIFCASEASAKTSKNNLFLGFSKIVM
jgi:hypothetical protein